MADFLERVRSLSTRQQITLAGGALAFLVMAAAMVRMMTAEPMALLYSGLDNGAAGEVVSALDAEGIDYDVRGSSLFVPRSQRDRLRLTLAQQNLPAPTTEGYELLDGLDGFSTTSEMFSVTYWRAKEGELARTLMAMPGITAARVHIGAEDRGAFSRRDRQRTASVSITAPGGTDSAQLKAIQYLTALAVPGLAASEVAVIDSARGLLTNSDGEVGFDETRRAKLLERDLLALLEARVGRGNARVTVALDTIREREEIAEETVDPESAVVMERSREERRNREQGTERALTVASDLPDGETQGADRTAETDELREDLSYAISRTERRVERLPGGVARLSVAVLLNENADDAGEVLPRDEAELNDLRTLVAAAAGLNEERGDTVIIRSMPFAPVVPVEAPPVSLFDKIYQPWLLPAAGFLVMIAAIGIFIVRPMMSAQSSSASASSDLLIADQGFDEIVPSMIAEPSPVEMLRERSNERPEEAATLLNAWLDERQEA